MGAPSGRWGWGARREPRYLLVVLQLIVQDDAIGLVRLGPRQGDAVHGAAHLVHDGHSRWSWKRGQRSGGGAGMRGCSVWPNLRGAQKRGSVSPRPHPGEPAGSRGTHAGSQVPPLGQGDPAPRRDTAPPLTSLPVTHLLAMRKSGRTCPYKITALFKLEGHQICENSHC